MISVRTGLILLGLAVVASGGRALVPEDHRRRLEVLRAEIRRHDDLYFKRAAPEISDAAYDELKREEAGLEKASPSLATAMTADETAGDDRSGRFPTYRHRQPMLSLDKAYSEAELRSFYSRLARRGGTNEVTCVVEPKFDGVAISVTYAKGELIRAATRGDGAEGDDVTANVRAIPGLPAHLRAVAADGTANPIPELIELRGEIYLPLAAFARINREREAAGETPYGHPRTLAAGTLKQPDPAEVAERGLAVVFYGWGGCQPQAMQSDTQQAFHRQIAAWGLPGVEKRWVVHGADEMWTAVRKFERERAALDFPTDGVVVKLDKVGDRTAFGASRHAPRWAMAYKFSPERAETRLRAITLQVGRAGVLTPLAELDPVRLGGATVARVSLYNRAEIARRDVRVGDMVYVEKSGEVIPTLAGVNRARRKPDSRPFEFPADCPVCHTRLASETGDVAVRCPNSDCPAQVRRRLQHFASAAAVNIPGLGPAMIDGLIARGAVKGIPDLYRLRREDLAGPNPGPGRTQAADRLLAALVRSLQSELWRYIYGLGIPHVGRAAAEDLARRFGGLEALRHAGVTGEFTGQVAADDLNAGVKSALIAYFAESRNRAVVTELITLGAGRVSGDAGGE